MTMTIQRVNANSPAQAVKSRARGPTITQLRAKQAALVAAAELAASSDAEASVVRPVLYIYWYHTGMDHFF